MLIQLLEIKLLSLPRRIIEDFFFNFFHNILLQKYINIYFLLNFKI